MLKRVQHDKAIVKGCVENAARNRNKTKLAALKQGFVYAVVCACIFLAQLFKAKMHALQILFNPKE